MPNVGLPELLVIQIVFAVLCYFVARTRGRNAAGWAVLGFLFSFIPLIVLPVIGRP